MAGLYKSAFSNPGMGVNETNGHWKREQDNYLSQIGAMELIKRDPNAKLGYDIRSDNPDRTLRMGSNIDPAKFYGLYQFRPNSEQMVKPRYDGTMDVSVELPPGLYGSVTAHELGHVGSRNSQSDPQLMQDPAGEEIRQRFVDIANNPPGSQMRKDGIAILMQNYGLGSEDIRKGVEEAEVKLGMRSKKEDRKPTKKKKQKLQVSEAPADAAPEEGMD